MNFLQATDSTTKVVKKLVNGLETCLLDLRSVPLRKVKGLLVISSLSIGVFLLPGCTQPSTSPGTESTSATKAFSNSSLQGTYAMIDIGEGGEAPIVGTTLATFDGQGKFEGRTLQSFPGGTPNTRRINETTFSGEYQLEAKGDGTGIIATNLPNGSVSENNLNFVITKAQIANNQQQAQEFYLIPQQLVPAANLMTVMGKRLPDGGEFSNGSLKGNYAYTLLGQGGQTPQSGLGVVSCDGQGSCSGQISFNQPGTSEEGRTVVMTDVVQPYTINADGTGRATPANESEILLLITQAEVMDNVKVAQEVFFIVQDPDPTTQNVITGFMTKLVE
ncbi:MAG: hypothetical protein QNJ33_13125 [Crocosphaera sp.]|nr:hypothetical protein [Crocosphaera sp.]